MSENPVDELLILEFKSQKDWEEWLDKNHGQQAGVWLKFAKKNSGETTVSFVEALDSAICFGWIDSQGKSLNDKFYLQKFSPRRAKSVWSKINVGRVERLISEGKMMLPGMAQVEAAKADGRWDKAYAPVSQAKVPEDFAKALAKNKKAADFFETLSKSKQYSFIWRLHNAKKPETRARNIENFVSMLAEGKTLN